MKPCKSLAQLKIPNNKDLQYTRNNTQTFINITNLSNIPQKQSKIYQHYWKARTIIDDLINKVDEKCQINNNAIGTIHHANSSALDLWKNDNQNNLLSKNTQNYYLNNHQQMRSDIDPQRMNSFQKLKPFSPSNRNFNRRFNQSQNQHTYMIGAKPQYKQHNRTLYSKGNNDGQYKRNLFEELQDLKAENEKLRQQTINLIKGSSY